jgi:glycosyltransferase involved in cell wall biosynthesis
MNISVVVITFNQASYIRRAVESVISQTDVTISEILIGNDGSLDETDVILKGIQERLPGLIKVINRKKNIGPTANLYDLLKRSTGDFVAILEGDDYWTSPMKLARQIKFLSQNPDYVACTTRYKIVDRAGNVIQSEYFGPGRPKLGLYMLTDFENYRYFGLISSVLFRNIFRDSGAKYEILRQADRMVGDITLNLILLLEGKVRVLPDNTAAHRIIVSPTGSNFKSIIRRKNQLFERISLLERLSIYAHENYGIKINFTSRKIYYLGWSIAFAVRYPSSHNLQALISIIKKAALKKI